MKVLIALWHIMKALVSFKRGCEAKGASRLNRERGLEDRLKLERISYALETGNTENLPKTVQWLFAHTKLDNQAGEYFIALLKSSKLERGDDKSLNQPLYRHT